MKRLVLTTTVLMLSPLVEGAEQTYRVEHSVVSYSGISEEYARAIAQVVAAARLVAAEQFDFDMPKTVRVKATCSRKGGTRLFTDGHDRLYLNVRDAEDLRKPSESGFFHVYGLCHEIGHLVLQR